MSTSIVSVDDLFGCWVTHPDATAERVANATLFLPKVNMLLQDAIDDGVPLKINPNTQNYVGGAHNGFGGFRPQNCAQGAPGSSHKQGRGVDMFDPHNALDTWLDKFEVGFGHNTKLASYSLYREAPEDTISWCHLTDRAPDSKKNTFKP